VRSGFQFRFALRPLHPGVRRMGRLMAPAVIGLAVTQINLLVDNKLASYLGTGAISSLQYAMRLFQLPLGVFAVSIATALLPRLASSAARGEEGLFSGQLRQGVEGGMLVLLPAMVGLFALGQEIITLLFQHGSFSPQDTARTAHILYFYIIGILPYGLVYTFTRAFYALGRTSVPLIASAGAVAANIAFDLLLVGPLWARGLALATAISGIVNAAILGAALSKRLTIGGITVGKIGLGCGILYAGVIGVKSALHFLPLGANIVLSILTGVLIYAGFARMSGLTRIVSRVP